GRGAGLTLDMPGGKALLIDESYNANPASMRAALALLGHANVGPLGRRIAVLGDMLELGPRGADLHRELAMAVLAHDVDLVFCCGPLMHALWEALPSRRKGGYAETPVALESHVLAAVQPGDAIMVMDRSAHGWRPSSRRCKAAIAARRPISCPPKLRPTADPCSTGSPHSRTRSVPLTFCATSRSAPAARCSPRSCSSFCSVTPSSTSCGSSKARASRSAATGRNRTSSPRRARPPWAG